MGDEEFKKLFSDPEVLGKLRQVVIGRQVAESDREDVLQETLKRAWEKRDKFDRTKSNDDSLKGAIIGWLCGIAGKVLYEMWRHQKRSGAQDLRAIREPEDTTVRAADHRLNCEEDAKKFRELFAKLDPCDRHIIERRYYHEETLGHIAEGLQMKPATARQRFRRAMQELSRMWGQSMLSYDGGLVANTRRDFRLYLSLRYLDALEKADYGAIAGIWGQATDDPHLEQALIGLDEAVDLDLPSEAPETGGPAEVETARRPRMTQYETVRREFHDLQGAGRLTETRLPAIEILRAGVARRGTNLPHGLNGVCILKRDDGTLICEQAFLGGAVDGYARYFSRKGELVGEDYYEQGGVVQTRVFQ